MPDPTSVNDIQLSPIPGKEYFSIDREWREEFMRLRDRWNAWVLSGPALGLDGHVRAPFSASYMTDLRLPSTKEQR